MLWITSDWGIQLEGMVKGLNPHATFAVEETLWDGEKCRVLVNDTAE